MNNSTHQTFSWFAAAAVFLTLGLPAVEAQNSIVPAQASGLATASIGEHKKVEGTITGRNGDKMTLRLDLSESNLAVKISSSTQIREKKSNPFRKGRKYLAEQLTPGLAVEVDGRGDSDGALVAGKILFTNDDLKLARTINTRIAPVEQNELRMSGQLDELNTVSNAARGGAKAAQDTADNAHARIAALDDYEAARSVSVQFKVGSAVLSEEARRSLDDVAMQTKDMKGFVIEVAGFASSEGGLAFNQRLSRQRAEAVSEYLVEKHDIPLRRIMTPTGYGVSHPVSDNSTHAGRQENRRVEVRLMVNRGITAQASTGQPTPGNPQRVGVGPDHTR